MAGQGVRRRATWTRDASVPDTSQPAPGRAGTGVRGVRSPSSSASPGAGRRNSAVRLRRSATAGPRKDRRARRPCRRPAGRRRGRAVTRAGRQRDRAGWSGRRRRPRGPAARPGRPATSAAPRRRRGRSRCGCPRRCGGAGESTSSTTARPADAQCRAKACSAADRPLPGGPTTSSPPVRCTSTPTAAPSSPPGPTGSHSASAAAVSVSATSGSSGSSGSTATRIGGGPARTAPARRPAARRAPGAGRAGTRPRPRRPAPARVAGGRGRTAPARRRSRSRPGRGAAAPAGADRTGHPAPRQRALGGEHHGDPDRGSVPDQAAAGRTRPSPARRPRAGPPGCRTRRPAPAAPARPRRCPRAAAPVDLLAEPRQQPHAAVRVGPVDRRAAVREPGGLAGQCAATVVQDVHVQPVGWQPVDRFAEHGAQGGRPAAARPADDEPAARRRGRVRTAPAPGRRAGPADRSAAVVPSAAAPGCRSAGSGSAGSRAAAGRRSGSGGSQGRPGGAARPRRLAGQRGHHPLQVAPGAADRRQGCADHGAPAARGTARGDHRRRGPPVPETRADLDQHRRGRAGPHVRTSGPVRWQVGRGGAAEDVPGVALVGGAQADAQRAVGPDLRTDHPRRGAGSPAPGGRRGDRPRWAMPTSPWTKAGSSSASEANSSTTITSRLRGHPVGQFGEVPDAVLGEQPLPAGQLGGQRTERPGGRLVVQVGDHADGVREGSRLTERRAALVVDEQEAAPVRRVVQREAGDQRLEQLGLARAGRPGDQGVRPVGDQVDAGAAACAGAEHRAQPVTAAVPRRPPGSRIEPQAGRRQVQQPRGVGQPYRRGRDGQRGEVAGDAAGGRSR